MASYNTFTAINSSPALRGQDILVQVYPSQAATYFGGMYNQNPNIPNFMRAVVKSSGAQGYLSQVDVYGNSFKVKPQQTDGNLASNSTPGLLNAGDVVTIFNIGT
jgi:hypothetical protein